MSADIELEELSRRVPYSEGTSEDTAPNEQPDSPQNDDQTVAYWAWGASALFLSAAVPLILFPQFVLFASETSAPERRVALTPLESFLSLHVGILLVAISLALVFNIPTSVLPQTTAPQGAPGHPLLRPLAGACALIAFISYNTRSVGSLGLLLFAGSATVGVWGLWTEMFAGSSYISKKTGADKRTSAFIFGNKSAASVKKKLWKKGQAKAKAQ